MILGSIVWLMRSMAYLEPSDPEREKVPGRFSAVRMPCSVEIEPFLHHCGDPADPLFLLFKREVGGMEPMLKWMSRPEVPVKRSGSSHG